MSISAPENYIPSSLQKVIQTIREGKFGERDVLMSLISTITNNNDVYLVGADFESYIEIQSKVNIRVCRLMKHIKTNKDGLRCRLEMQFVQESSVVIALSANMLKTFGVCNNAKFS